MSDLISILIPNYNKAPYLRECLDSVFKQTYSNWECIIVDDHSTDDSWEILQEYTDIDNRFRVFRRPTELAKGGNSCRNFALKIADGFYCIFFDSDDVLADFCLAQRMEAIISLSGNDFWVFRSLMFDQEPSDATKLWNIETKEEDLIRFLRMDALWQTTGPIYKKSFVKGLGGFNESLAFWQDYDLHLRAIIFGGRYIKVFNFPPDVYIREGDKKSLSRSTPFTADKDILSKRIKFFNNLEDYSLRSGYKLSKDEDLTRISILFFFVSQYWIKHGDFELFAKEWKLIIRNYTPNRASYFLGIVHISLIKLAIKFSFTQRVKEGFEKLFNFRLLDYYLINNTLMGKASYPSDAIP